MSEIQYTLTFINEHICTYFAKRATGNQRRHRDEPTISRGELTRLWQERRRQAVEIIHNDSKKSRSAGCGIDTDSVHRHFQKRCQRVLTQLGTPPWKDEVTIPPPQWTPPQMEFTLKEVTAIISQLPSRRSPGADGVTYDYVKRCKQTLAPVFTAIMNACARNRRVPSDWKHSIITLVPKKNGNPENIEDWRPISLLCTSYKIYMKLIQQKLVPWIVDTQRLSARQKGSMPRNGLQEHVFTLKTDITDFLHRSAKMFVGFIDIKDAFGSIDHKMMLREMEETGYPEEVIAITRDIYTQSTFQVKTATGLTKPITRGKGIIQGCPWSVIIFEQGIDKWLRWIEQSHAHPSLPNPVQGYVDDVDVTATNHDDIQAAADKTDRFMRYTGMEVKHRKCAVLQGQRSGNNWAKRDTTVSTQLSVQDAPIPRLDRNQAYTYLGHSINLADTAEKEQVEQIIAEYQATMEKIDVAPLPVAAKLEAVNTMASCKLHFYFPNNMFTEKVLDRLEDSIVFYVRSWLGLNNSSTRSFMFCPRNKGGLGLLNPRLMYYSKKLSFFLSVLNSDDDQTRHTARESLRLHLGKRKCEKTFNLNKNFAGYRTDNNHKLIKTSKVNWHQSQWIHMNELCCKLGVQLHQRGEDYVLKICTDDEVTLTMFDPKAFFTSFKQLQIDQLHLAWQEKESQGRLARVENIDHSLSCSHLVNLHLTDNLIRFIIKAKLQLAECNSLLHTYYPATYRKSCSRCGFHSDTISHVLNGCRESKNAIQKRHNRIVNMVSKNLSETNVGSYITTDRIVTPEQFCDSTTTFAGTEHTRPDICVINHEARTCLIIEVAVPFDAFINECYQHKFNKYLPLCQKITDLGFSCRVIVLVIGSLGAVHKRFLSGLKIAGISPSRGKAVVRYCSVSAMIGSYIIWRQRCRALQYI